MVAAGGEIVNEQDWGMRPMAYEIRHQAQAEYHLLQFHPTRELLANLERTLRITDGVVRFRIIKLAPGTPEPPEPSRPPTGAGRPSGRDRPTRPPSPGARVRRAPRASTLQRKSARSGLSAGGVPGRLYTRRRHRASASFAPERSTADGGHEHQPGDHHREPDVRSRAALAAQRDVGLQAARRLQHAAQGQLDRRVGRQAELLRRHRLGRPGRELARYLSKGRPVAIDGRLEWREWEDKDGNKRQSVDIIADAVQFLGGRDDAPGGGGGFTPRSDIPVDTGDFAAAPAGNGTRSPSAPADDDIPF